MFLDGNKRTAMLAGNQVMISSGCGVISVPIEPHNWWSASAKTRPTMVLILSRRMSTKFIQPLIIESLWRCTKNAGLLNPLNEMAE